MVKKMAAGGIVLLVVGVVLGSVFGPGVLQLPGMQSERAGVLGDSDKPEKSGGAVIVTLDEQGFTIDGRPVTLEQVLERARQVPEHVKPALVLRLTASARVSPHRRLSRQLEESGVLYKERKLYQE